MPNWKLVCRANANQLVGSTAPSPKICYTGGHLMEFGDGSFYSRDVLGINLAYPLIGARRVADLTLKNAKFCQNANVYKDDT